MLGGTAIEIGNAYLRFTMAGKLRDLRTSNGTTHQEVADFIGITAKEYEEIESGYERINVEILMRILQFFETPMVDFFAELQFKDISPEDRSLEH